MPLLRKDNCRSARIFTDVQRFSVQISNLYRRSVLESVLEGPEKFSWEVLKKIFPDLLVKLCISFFSFFSRYFCWPTLSQLKLSITQNSWAGNLVPITVILVSGEYSVLVIHCNLSISLELSRSGFSILRGSFAILTSFWRMKFDMWQPSGLVEVLIECCGCNILGTWFAGVVLLFVGITHWSKRPNVRKSGPDRKVLSYIFQYCAALFEIFPYDHF